MTPKEKAEEIIDKYCAYTYGEYPEDQLKNAQKCALIHAEGIIEENHLIDNDHLPVDETIAYLVNRLEFWLKVKQEIQNI